LQKTNPIFETWLHLLYGLPGMKSLPVNGEEAVQVAQREYPDLILLDVRMPRMTGYEACKLIKADPKLKDVPVVFLSAKGQEAEIRDGMDAGAEEYLLKPFAPDQLTDRVRSILAKFGK
jgi:two-component system, OmpR family, alkaline phosphatase synthesis response regulator PhoP